MPTKEKNTDICQRKRPSGELCCGHTRKQHKPDKIHLRTKTNASSGGYTEAYINLAPTHCTELCSCVAFIEKDGSSHPGLPASVRKNPFIVEKEVYFDGLRDRPTDQPFQLSSGDAKGIQRFGNTSRGNSQQQPRRKGSKNTPKTGQEKTGKRPKKNSSNQGGLF